MNALWERIRLFAQEQLSRLQVKSAERRLRETQVHLAIERVVDQANPRIRALPGYRRKLFDAVSRSLDHCMDLTGRIPGPVLLNRETWSTDPLINALFGSHDRMRWVLTSPGVRAYIKETGLESSDCYAVLSAFPETRNQLGMEVLGDTLQRDVKQTTVSFAAHEVGLAGPDPQSVRASAAQAAMDILVGVAVKDIAAQEEQIAEFEDRLRIVRIKRKSLSPGARGMDFLSAGSQSHLAEYEAMGKRIQELEKDLADARQGLSTLDDYLDRLDALLQHPERHIGAKLERVRLDRMNVIRAQSETGSREGTELEFLRGYRDDKPGRVLLLVRFSRSEIIPESERLAKIERYANA